VTEFSLTRAELDGFGVDADAFSPDSHGGRRLMQCLFDAADTLCGLRRNGHLTFMEYRPYINGGCRVRLGFTQQPSARLYAFANADDLLDALVQLRGCGDWNVIARQISRKGEQFWLRVPPNTDEEGTQRHDLAILSEYAQ
jgi:hypothetical protein